MQCVLDVHDLRTTFHTRDGEVHAVNGLSLRLHAGELLAVVGESGSGKSVAMMSMLRLLPARSAQVTARRIDFQGQDLAGLSDEAMRRVRGAKIGFVFQDPMTTLNPVLTVGFQIAEPLRRHLGLSAAQARRRAIELLDMVGIAAAARRVGQYPHQFSGGMRQRVVIALALACNPDVLIADEPTTALDVTVQAQILELVARLRRELGMAIIWITHDLGVAASIADRVMVMYAGNAVEEADTEVIFSAPRHPYTRALLDALPGGHAAGQRLRTLGGQPPLLMQPPRDCAFAPRCERVQAQCRTSSPVLAEVASMHKVACWRACA